MSFNSTAFLVFFLSVFVIYRFLPHKAQNIFLLLASYFFFGSWDVRFLFLIIFSTSLDFVCGLLIADGQISKRNRIGPSVAIIAGGFIFIVIPWEQVNSSGFSPIASLKGLFEWNNRWIIFFAIVALVAAFNFYYKKLKALEDHYRRRVTLTLSILGNIGILGFFKYFNFFLANLEVFIRSIGIDPGRLHLNIILPIGISFYTFMTLSYTIDIYKNRMTPTRVFHHYALYVAFFPKLLAGPIERARSFLPQIEERRTVSTDGYILGFQEIILGLFKKTVIADGLAASVASVFVGTYQLSWTDAVLGAIFFTIQIYCDFSGYSDIATGISRLLGFNLMRNFHVPYFSRDPSEFWNRWHISLSSWFRDYVFFPIGGPYGKTWRWMRNIMITFLITGLWHGAAWTFVLWGCFHGILLCLHRLRQERRPSHKRSRNSIKKWAHIVLFFILTSLGWVLFRAGSMHEAWRIYKAIFGRLGDFTVHMTRPAEAVLLGLPLLVLIDYFHNKSRGKSLNELFPLPIWTAANAAMIFLTILGLSNVSSGFIYIVF